LDYCSICYVNEIQQGNAPITDDITVQLDCRHRFCIDCCRVALKEHIKNNALNKIVCFSENCGVKVTSEQVDQIFGDSDPEIL
jgi:hypothetical protein